MNLTNYPGFLNRLQNSYFSCNFYHMFHSSVPQTIKDSVIFVKNSTKVCSYLFLLRCRSFLPRCTSLMFTLSIKSTSNCPKSLLKLDKVRAALPLSVRIVGLEKIALQVGNVFIMYCFSWSNSSRICLDVFETTSFVPICSIICKGFFLSKGTKWYFRSSIAAPLKSRNFTTWLFLDSRFSSIVVNIESPNIKQVPAGHACLKLSGVSSLLALSFLCLLLYSELSCFR